MADNTELAPVYRYYTADLLTNEILSEVPFRGVSYERAIKGAGAFQGSIPVIEATKNLDLYETTMPGKTALYVVRNDVCVWGGIIWSRSYNVVDRVLSVTASEFTSYFYHRRIWKTFSHQFGATVVCSNGSADVTLDYGSTTDALKAQSSVKLEFPEESNRRYNSYYTISGSPTPTKSGFHIEKAENVSVAVQAQIVDGVATIYCSEAHNLHIGDLVTLDFGPNSVYNGTHSITAVSGPSLERFSYLEADATRALQTLTATDTAPNTVTRKLPDGTYTGVTVSVRTDTYDYIRSLVTAVFDDFVGADFPNVYIEPGLSLDFDISEREVSDGIATITTSEDHGLSIGQAVQVKNLDSLWDGEYIVQETPADNIFRFALGGTLDATSVQANGHEVSDVSVINGDVSITTTTPHGFLVGQEVQVDTGIESGGLGAYLNGTFTVTSTPAPNKFKYVTSSYANVPDTSLIPALATSASDVNLFPNPSFEGVIGGTTVMRENLVKWNTISGNSSYFASSNTVGGGTGSLAYTLNPSYPSGFALRYIVSIPPTTAGAYVTTSTNNASGFDATVGYTYTASVYIYSTYDMTAYIAIPWRNAAGTNFSSSNGVSTQIKAGVLTRLFVTAVAPADTITGGVRVFHNSSGATTGQWFEYTSHMVEQTDQLREFFDGSLPNKYGYDYNWSGPANRSTSIAIATPVAVRTNMSVNPSADVVPGTGTLGFNSAVTVTRSSAQSYSNGYSFACTHSGITGTNRIGLRQQVTVQNGKTYAFSARIYIPSSNVGTPSGTGRIQFGSEYSEFVFTPNENLWYRISGTLTVSITEAQPVYAAIAIYPNSVWAANDVIYLDNLLIEESTTINSYFDGKTQGLGDFTYAWSGVEGGSSSYQLAPSIYGINTNECIAYQSVDWASADLKRSMRITPTNSISNNSYVYWYIPEFEVGKTYTIKAKVRLADQLNGTLASNSRRIRVMQNDTIQIARSGASPNFSAARDSELTFVVPAGTTSLRVDFYNGASKENGDVWWDDVLVVEGGDAGFDVGYFDGDEEPHDYYTYAWSGVPHLSQSERRITTSISSSELTSNVVTLTTAIPHGFAVGREVVVAGVTPELEILEKSFDAVSGVAEITTAAPHEFQVGEIVEISGLRDASEITKRLVSGSNVTLTTRLAHNFASGDVITISDMFDVCRPTHKSASGGIVTLALDKPHNISSGDELTISEIFDVYSITAKRLVNNVARLTLASSHNFKVNDAISIAGVVDTAQVISKTVENGIAVLTTRYAHNFLEEEEVTITGLGAPYDGTFKIASFTDAQILYAVEYPVDEILPLTAANGLITGSNSVFVGDYTISAVTTNTVSYNRVANSVNTTSVSDGVVLGVSPLNGTYTVLDTPSSTSVRYAIEGLNDVALTEIPLPVVAEDPADQQPPASAAIPSIHSGERTIKSVTRNTVTFTQSGIQNNVALESVAGVATVDSIFNGSVSVTSVTENTFTYALTSPSNVLETAANNLSYVRAYGIFNGTYTITSVDQQTNSFTYARTHANRTKTRVLGYGYAEVRPVAIVSSFGPYPGNANIGIGFSTKEYSGTSIDPILYRGFELKNVGEALNAYSDSVYGFEYRIDCSYDTTTGAFTKTFVLIPIDFPNPPVAGELSPISRFGADKYVFDYPGNIINVSIEESAENSSTRFFAVGENDLGPDAGPPMGVAATTDLLDGANNTRRWPLLDDDEQIKGVEDESVLYAYASRYLTEARPPDAKLSVSVNGSLQPVIGTYAPGDWCALIVKDEFLLERMASGLEPRTDVIVRKIDSMKIAVPDGTTFPEKVDLVLVPEWEVDKRG